MQLMFIQTNCVPQTNDMISWMQTRSFSICTLDLYATILGITLKEDGSKHRLKFLLDRKELTLTLDDFRTIFHLPQANDNNHASFVPPPSFSDMVPFYKQVLGFTMELKTVSNFKIPGLLQPWKKQEQEVFGLDVPRTQSQPTESTQGTHRITSAPRSPNPATEPVLTSIKADEMILQDMIQVSLAEQKSREEQEARENVALVYEHLAAEEIVKLVEEFENVMIRSFTPLGMDDTSLFPTLRLEPSSDKESPEVRMFQEKRGRDYKGQQE
ncbi:hypothetical protein Tco_1247332 [Tanacetum coccineum]